MNGSASGRTAYLRAQIAQQQAACGCELGTLFALAALACFVAEWLAGEPGWSAAGTLGRGLVWVIGWSFVGKLLGLGYARLRLVQLRAELRRTSIDRPHLVHPGKD